MTSRCSLWLVTRNKHKYDEISNIMSKYYIKIYQAPIGKTEIQSNSLSEIALNAAINAFNKIKKPLIVDDSGLFIEELKGFPGVYSRFVFDTVGINGILKIMHNTKNRDAYFETVAVAIIPPLVIIKRGRVYGEITYKPRGTRGFGFDPIFKPKGLNKTFAEMTIEEKNNISHRARAFRELAISLSKLWKCTS